MKRSSARKDFVVSMQSREDTQELLQQTVNGGKYAELFRRLLELGDGESLKVDCHERDVATMRNSIWSRLRRLRIAGYKIRKAEGGFLVIRNQQSPAAAGK